MFPLQHLLILQSCISKPGCHSAQSFMCSYLKLTIYNMHDDVGFITYFKCSLLKRLKNVIYSSYIITHNWIPLFWSFPQFLA